MISTVWDVTERNLQQNALQKEQREKNFILKNLSELVNYLDLEMRIIWANLAVSNTHRKRPEEYLGHKCYSIWHGFDQPCPGCPVTTVIKTGMTANGETRSPDGLLARIGGDEFAVFLPHTPDGSGYPLGLNKDAIPIECRILAVVDAFDAMTYPRPYNQIKTVSDALEELKLCAGSQFDPRVVDLFINCFNENS